MDNVMRSFICWGHGREKDFGVLLPMLPKDIDTLLVPFLGSGDILLNAEAKRYVASERCDELVDLWRFVSRPQPVLQDLLSAFLDLWEVMPKLSSAFKSRLFEVYDTFVMGALKDYSSMAGAVGRIARELTLPEGFTQCVKCWKEDEWQMELTHQWILALEAAKPHRMTDSVRFQGRIANAALEAMFEYMVFLYNRPEVKPQVKAAFLLWTMSCAKNHLFLKDEMGEYTPEFCVEEADSADFLVRMKTLETPDFYTRMQQTAFCKKEGLVMLNFEKPGERDFIFADPPCLYGPRKKRGRLFSNKMQQGLADYLLNKTRSRWMVILPQRDPVTELYSATGANCLAMNDELVFWNY